LKALLRLQNEAKIRPKYSLVSRPQK